MKTWDMMIHVSLIEQNIINLRRLTCDGSMLKGHIVNEEKAQGNKTDVLKELFEIEQRITEAKRLFNEE